MLAALEGRYKGHSMPKYVYPETVVVAPLESVPAVATATLPAPAPAPADPAAVRT